MLTRDDFRAPTSWFAWLNKRYLKSALWSARLSGIGNTDKQPKKVNAMTSFQRITAGRADVYRDGKRIGSVDRREDGKWVPLTPAKEGWANPPQFPAFPTQKAAAEALATGEVVY